MSVYAYKYLRTFFSAIFYPSLVKIIEVIIDGTVIRVFLVKILEVWIVSYLDKRSKCVYLEELLLLKDKTKKCLIRYSVYARWPTNVLIGF